VKSAVGKAQGGFAPWHEKVQLLIRRDGSASGIAGHVHGLRSAFGAPPRHPARDAAHPTLPFMPKARDGHRRRLDPRNARSSRSARQGAALTSFQRSRYYAAAPVQYRSTSSASSITGGTDGRAPPGSRDRNLAKERGGCLRLRSVVPRSRAPPRLSARDITRLHKLYTV